jgi:ribosomal protein S6--L-glutamate ligase
LAALKIGVIGIPGKWSTETLADELQARTGFRLVVDMAQVILDLETGRLLVGDQDLCQLDGLIIKKISSKYSPNTLDRLELLRLAEAAGVAVFSRPERILRLIDRLSCTVTLRHHGIPMPETRVTEDLEAALAAIDDFGAAVFKPLYSTKARGMCVIKADSRDRQARVRAFQADNPMMYIQKKVALPGQDLGMVFLNNEYLGSYARVGSNEAWNTTIHSGGRYEKAEPD